MNTIVYSAIYGDYDKPINQCIKQKPILFSDKRHDCNWSVKVVKKRGSSDRMRAKYYKCNPHKELKCDVSIYIDGSGTIKTGKFVERCLELLGDADIASAKGRAESLGRTFDMNELEYRRSRVVDIPEKWRVI